MVVFNLCIAAAVAVLPVWGLPHPQGSPPSSSGGEGPRKAAPALHVPSALLGAGVVGVPAAIGGALLLKKIGSQRSEGQSLQHQHELLGRQHQILREFYDAAQQEGQQARDRLQAQEQQHAQEMLQAQAELRAHELLADSKDQAAWLLKLLQAREQEVSAAKVGPQWSVEHEKHLDMLIHELWRGDSDHKLLPARTMMPTAFERDLDMRDCVLQTYLEYSTFRFIQGIDTHVTWDTAVNKCLEKLHRPDADKHDWYLQGSRGDSSYRPPATAHAIQQEEQQSKARAEEPPNQALQFSKHAAAQVMHASRKWAPFVQRSFRFLEHPGADAIPAELRWAGEHHL
ncbi:MAG: hypothetical protein M1826_004196 [Phylliscum demangeonii]|nr:MAG: hypothetical protein M1826_004196 [Phylliscum demangeonii]